MAETTRLNVHNLSSDAPRPRSLDQRVGLAIHWALSHHGMPVSDKDRLRLKQPVEGLARSFQRELAHLGLKLVWADGSDLAEAQLGASDGAAEEAGKPARPTRKPR
jgi:hypothetical protein